jgi:hypothetical protein
MYILSLKNFRKMNKKVGVIVRIIGVILFATGVVVVFLLSGFFDIESFKIVKEIGRYAMIVGAFIIGFGFFNPSLR